ncbi:amino acid adenylation domain-containing protein [Streptomyces sp. ME08-AFT2]|uniref:amino acid adenylation domain-containing protein n=1 Tax=Streptomyces sp. ME08-AFT2 TaxID=3028683 RepID=UPI0029B75D38|nr:amino acid adenylation domain-containing protein [Streptomyces sp. ME08-AFT2]MDX3312444.1 amino acid adenylation domain-containing protein [Streptomyces sp. ME08-AFT2]
MTHTIGPSRPEVLPSDPWATGPEGATAPELATDRPRLTAGEHRAEVEHVTLDPRTAARLCGAADAVDESAMATVTTAWAAVLHRHTGQRDMLIAVAAEPFTAAETVPVRLALRPDASFAEERRRCQDVIADARATVRDAGPPPAALLDRVRTVITRGDAPGLREASFETALALSREQDRLLLTLRYDAALFARRTASWLLGHCATLLEQAAERPESTLRELRVQPTPTPPAWTLPVPDGHTFPAPAAPGECLVDRFTEVSAAHGTHTAVTGPSGTLTYAELDALTHRLAGRLSTHAGPGRRVALLCEHDLGAVVAPWAALRTGAAYVPLDPRQPDGRLREILRDADVCAILTDPSLRDRATTLAGNAPVVEIDFAKTPAPTDGPPHRVNTTPVPASDPAYLLYTSGSTGRPKGVLQIRHNVLTHTLTYAARLRIGPGAQIPLLARHTFDAAVMDLYAALLTGATLHVIDPVATPGELRARLYAARASLVHCTPTLFRHLVDGLSADATQPDQAFVTVRAVVLGGEEAGQHDLRMARSVFPADCRLVNGLGPTECTLVLQHLAGPADLESTTLPVGHPVDGVEVQLLDEDGHPTEILGELTVHTERVARGYWNLPDATATAFDVTGEGTPRYRSGDIVRRTAGGSLVFQGRRDRQIKVRGHRVEPAEIEAVLRRHPTVAEAVVTVDRRPAAPRLLGYVTPATGFPPDPEELHGYLTRALPEYAVPWRVVSLERLPLGPTGKLAHARLPLPDDTPAVDGTPAVTEVQQAVAAIWCRVLGIPRAGLHTNFMASGGDSIRMTLMLSSVHEEFGVEVALDEFLTAPTVATVAAAVEREKPC